MTADPNQGSLERVNISQYSEKIINTMSEALILVAPDGTILMVNQSFERMLGYKSEEVIGQSCTKLNCDVCELGRDTGQDCWCSLFQFRKDVKKRCHIRKKNGSYLTVLKNAALLVNDEDEDIGAVEILTDISQIDRLDQEIDTLSRRFREDGDFQGIVGKSEAIRNVFELVEKAAWSESPIIVYGESGTGKELIAQAIHNLGRRKEKPFVQLNCAALNESILESELFGHVKGAFTGAYRHRIGRFETAAGGDIFLDEIGDVPLSIQIKLLRVLEQKQIERVGDHQPIPVDVRLITATNKNLEELIAKSEFREDFYFRINVIPIYVPALRDRLDDIPLLTDHFIRSLRKKTGKKITGLTKECLELFFSYSWPGNIRELKSVLEYAFVVAEKGLISIDQIPRGIHKKEKSVPQEKIVSNPNDPREKVALINALNQSEGNQTQAAKILGVSRITVWNRMKKYNIDVRKTLAS